MFHRRIRLGTILGLLVVATTVPLGLFAAGLIRTSWQQQRALVDRQNIDTARAISVAIDQEVRATIAALNVLAALETIDDPRHFYSVASQMVALRPDWEAIGLVDTATGSVVVNTSVPFGTASSLVQPDWIATVRHTAKPAISTLRQDPASRLFFVSIGVPVVRAGTVKYVLGAQLRAATFSETVRRQVTPPGGVVSLLDATPVILARSRNEDRYIGTSPTLDFVRRSRDVPEGALRSVMLEGTPAYSAYTRSPLTGWTVGIGLPAEAIDGPIRRSFFWLIAVGVAILAGGIALAILVRRPIVQAQVSAAMAARALAAGEPVALPRSSIVEVHDLSLGLQEAGTILSRRLQERNEAQRQRERASADLEQALVAERDARAAGEKNQARLAVTLRSIADAVITTDDRGHVTMLNPVAQALTGWTEADAIGQPIERVFPTVKDPVHQAHGVLRARDGRQIPLAESTAPILAPDGSLLGAIVVFRDVTAEREADRQRAVLLDREQAARRAAEGLSRSKDEFVATVSHELRTPLNAIFGWVAMLRDGTLDGDRQRHALDVIHRNTLAQAQLIEDLLDMSRVVRGTVRLDMQPIDLAVAIDAALDTLLPTANARQIAIHVQADRGSAIVSGDLGRLQQVVWNLLSNSLKFTPPGGQVHVRLEVVGDDAVVHVTDSGEGITPEFLPHVFDRFRQETADVTRVHSGLGIGLSLVRHLTELHGGSVAATSDGKGRGATFSIRLPLLGSRAVPVTAPGPGRAIDGGPQPLLGRQLLVVDDDGDARELMSIAFSHGGASVTAVQSVAEALAAIEAQTPDAVITDIAMPNGTGFDLVRQLRADARTTHLPIVAITAYNRSEDRDRALAIGFDAHVGKPFDPRAIVALIAGLVEERAGSV